MQEIRDKTLQQTSKEDPVVQVCDYVAFLSESKGQGRRRRVPREVELIGYGGRFSEIKNGGGRVDEIATEVLGDSVPPEDAERVFLERLRRRHAT